MKKKLFLFLAFCFTVFGFGQNCNWKPLHPVQEIPYPISDWALTNIVNGQWVIFYNPTLMSGVSLGIQLFTKAHEYAHIELNHFMSLNQTQYQAIILRRENELAADSQAATWLIDDGCQNIVAEMAQFFDTIQYRNSTLPVWYPTYTERKNNLLNILNNSKESDEPIEFSIEIPYIQMGELGGIIEIWIDNENIGTISNFSEDFDTSIDIDQFKPGLHQYRLKVKIYTFKGYTPYYFKTIYGNGNINVDENDRFIVANGASNPTLIKD